MESPKKCSTCGHLLNPYCSNSYHLIDHDVVFDEYITCLEAKNKAQQEVLDYVYAELGKYFDGLDIGNDMRVDNAFKRIEKYKEESDGINSNRK